MSLTQKQNKGGRPAVDTEPLTVRLPRSMIVAIEQYRREQDIVPSRPEAVRRILQAWLSEHGHSEKD